MKSTIEKLRARGMFEENDLVEFEKMTREQLLYYINSDLAFQRSCSIHELMKRFSDNETIDIILERLSIEKALYTRLEICGSLEQSDDKIAEKMIQYLGEIGNNQYTELPRKVSKKISYPLPRDMIARSLGKMNPSILPILLAVLKTNDIQKIIEVIDAIGFLIFYNNNLATDDHLKYIIEMFDKYKKHEIIVWKSTICLSAFPLEKSIIQLKQIIHTYKNSIIEEEALRSIKIITER